MTNLSEIDVMDDFPGFPTVVVRRENLPTSELSTFMDTAMRTLGEGREAGAYAPSGPAFARYDTPLTDTVTLEVGFPVDTPLAQAYDGISGSSLPACRLATTKYRGAYDGLSQAWPEFLDAVRAKGLETELPCWEAYDTMPGPDTKPEDLVTGLAVPVHDAS